MLRSRPQLVKYFEACLALARTGGAYRTEAQREADKGEPARREALRRREALLGATGGACDYFAAALKPYIVTDYERECAPRSVPAKGAAGTAGI